MTLVLTLVELLRQLMERQALRRVEQGTLTDDQIEKVGSTLMALEASPAWEIPHRAAAEAASRAALDSFSRSRWRGPAREPAAPQDG